MAAQLKNLSVTSVGLVSQGANQDAYICLYKQKGAGAAKTKTEE